MSNIFIQLISVPEIMGFDLVSVILSIFTGLLCSILIIGYTTSESERIKMNEAIERLTWEINWNRNKLRIYMESFEKVKKQWQEERILSQIDDMKEISKGYGEYIYNLFSFDSYYYFINSGIHLDVNFGLDYSIKQFYHHCMEFCYNIQYIENKIHEYLDSGQDECINDELKKIDQEIYDIASEFSITTFAPSPGNEHRDKKEISWRDWHIYRNRRLNFLFKNNSPK